MKYNFLYKQFNVLNILDTILCVILWQPLYTFQLKKTLMFYLMPSDVSQRIIDKEKTTQLKINTLSKFISSNKLLSFS